MKTLLTNTYSWLPLFFSFSLLSLLLACGCGSGSGGPDAFDGEYSGAWDLRLNLTEDQCAIVEAGVLGFVDRQVIEQDGIVISVESSTNFGSPYTGTVREDGSFAAQESLAGNVFGDGIFCTVTQDLSYSPTSSDSAEVLFRREIECADGYVCESRAVGEATRQ